MPKRSPGLRTQFLFGLVLIILVATLTVGAITYFAMRLQERHSQVESGRLLGLFLANLLGGAQRAQDLPPAELQRLVANLSESPLVLRLEVVDPQLHLLASSPRRARQQLKDGELLAAVRTRQQIVRLEEDARVLWVATPLMAGEQLLGAMRLELPLGPTRFDWPLLFWLMMAVNGLVLVLFVERVVSRYVIGPVQEMQLAAARVAAGDLSVRLTEEGARELALLSGSFNQMTSSVKEQLERLELQRQALATSREHLIRSEKLASVGRLAAGVAHEVGNPLQAIIGFTDMLLGQELSVAEKDDFLARIQGEANRIHRIIRELLDYARPVEDAIESVSLSQVVEQSLQLVGPQQRLKEVAIQLEAVADLRPVAANGPRLVQVLVNLLLNAADALGGQGEIIIRGRELPAEGVVELQVENSGPPIPPEDQGRIFDPFFSTKEPGRGTGLGLSVAQSITESYGGRLTLDTAAPRTVFVLTLHPWEVGQGGAGTEAEAEV